MRAVVVVITLVRAAICQEFPAGAKIIEKADISAVAGAPRVMVLWMLRPERVEATTEYCGTAVHGTLYWKGPTRLSLVDPSGPRIINTVKILDPERDDSFEIPIQYPAAMTGIYYSTPLPVGGRFKVPKILALRDISGSGLPAEFVLYRYGACGIAYTSVAGYQHGIDRVLQYPIEARGEPGTFWVEQVFDRKPIRAGVWAFTWMPAHGSDDVIHAKVRFDKGRRVFVDESTVSHPIVK